MTSDDIKDTAKNLGSSAGKMGEDVKKSVQSAKEDAADSVGDHAAQASDTVGELYGRAKDTVRNATDGLPNSASDALAAGRKVYEGGTDQLVRQIAKQPLEALLLAGAIGYLVGWATSRS